MTAKGDKVLSTDDGAFTCTAEHAVTVAYMISCVEGAYLKADAPFEVLHVLEDYLRGNYSAEETVSTLMQEWPEAFPGARQKRDAP